MTLKQITISLKAALKKRYKDGDDIEYYERVESLCIDYLTAKGIPKEEVQDMCFLENTIFGGGYDEEYAINGGKTTPEDAINQLEEEYRGWLTEQ